MASATGCSSFQMESLSKHEADIEQTGSTSRMATRTPATPAEPSEADLAYARAAAADALSNAGRENSVPWRNPQTGVGGNITPLPASHSESGMPCRDFLASYVHGAAHSWLQGSACRTARGEWEVKSLKPLNSG